VPVVPVATGALVSLPDAGRKHPVTVTRFSELDGLLLGCDDDCVCATSAAVARPTIIVHVPVQIVLFM
jgi:hypothetical protein